MVLEEKGAFLFRVTDILHSSEIFTLSLRRSLYLENHSFMDSVLGS